MDNSIDVLIKRMDKLEKQNKLFKIVGIGSVILLFAFIVYSIIPISQIKAQRFIICDNQGKECGWLGVEKNLPKLVFEHELSKTTIEDQRLMFQHGEFGPFLVITIDGINAFNNDKKDALQGFMLTLSDDGSPYLSLGGKDARIDIDGKSFGISLNTKDILEINEPQGLSFSKWKSGTRLPEKYWRLPIGSLQ